MEKISWDEYNKVLAGAVTPSGKHNPVPGGLTANYHKVLESLADQANELKNIDKDGEKKIKKVQEILKELTALWPKTWKPSEE